MGNLKGRLRAHTHTHTHSLSLSLSPLNAGSFECIPAFDTSCSCDFLGDGCDVCARQYELEAAAGAVMLHHRAVPSDYTAYAADFITAQDAAGAVAACASLCTEDAAGACLAFVLEASGSSSGRLCRRVSWFDGDGDAVAAAAADFYLLPQCSACAPGYAIDRRTCRGERRG